jgi:hypothetical protein
MPEHRLDAELSLRGIIGFGIALIAVMVAITALMWWMSLAIKERVTANDPPPPALLEARMQELPPEPRLQSDPIGELAQLREEETAILTTPDWVDREAGVARIPIAAALAAVAERGRLPALADESIPAPPAASPEVTSR